MLFSGWFTAPYSNNHIWALYPQAPYYWSPYWLLHALMQSK